jgi:transcriptional regulator with XRE-family HTH domain
VNGLEIFERVRHLRKNLKMSQEKFGAALGVNRDVINNMEQNRLARPEQKEPLLRLICKIFNVRYEWLTTGEGDMFVESNDSIIDALVSEFGLDDIAKDILIAYTKLGKAQRDSIREFIKSLSFAVLEKVATDTRKEVLDALYNADMSEDEYNRVSKEMLETFNGAFSYSTDYVAPYAFDESAHNQYYGLSVDKVIERTLWKAASSEDNRPPTIKRVSASQDSEMAEEIGVESEDDL